mmetsp:Transcript_31927/g.83532  ORF Transcript_31927/g.83532 Transcript_31927/m.83532 type:complete len:131 (+) Transcript_31927:274-666(+)
MPEDKAHAAAPCRSHAGQSPRVLPSHKPRASPLLLVLLVALLVAMLIAHAHDLHGLWPCKCGHPPSRAFACLSTPSCEEVNARAHPAGRTADALHVKHEEQRSPPSTVQMIQRPGSFYGAVGASPIFSFW